MTDHLLARADEVLSELVEMIETARTLPMSTSCVIGRERALDLLDALREVLPAELMEARRVVAQRERLLSEAAERAEDSVQTAAEQSRQVLAEAQAQAIAIVEAARAEQAELVSAAGVQRAAVAEAARLTEQATAAAEATRAAAEQAAARLTTDAHRYASGTLTELVEQLQRLLSTAENGREALTRQQPPTG